MSNASQDKGIVLRGWEQAKADPRESLGQTPEEQTLGRFQKDVHNAREERNGHVGTAEQRQAAQKQQAYEPDNKEQPEQPNKSKQPLIGGVEQNIILDRDGSRVNVGHDRYAEEKQNEINKSQASSTAKQENRQMSYPQAQPSYDAAGELNHIDFMPDKGR